MNLIETYEHDEQGYKIMTSFGEWTVALMNETEQYRPSNINFMQKHNETDECFVLLKGKCVLFVADGDDKPQNLTAVPMVLNRVYNVKRGVWHTHTFHDDTQVFIVENRNTTPENSPKYYNLTDEQKKYIITNG